MIQCSSIARAWHRSPSQAAEDGRPSRSTPLRDGVYEYELTQRVPASTTASAARRPSRSPGMHTATLGRRLVHDCWRTADGRSGSLPGRTAGDDGNRVTFQWTDGCFGDWEMTHSSRRRRVTWCDFEVAASVRRRGGAEGHRGVQQRAVDARRGRVVSGTRDERRERCSIHASIRLGGAPGAGCRGCSRRWAPPRPRDRPFRETIHDERDVRASRTSATSQG